ncbi:hypothetical protein HDU76_006931 [Blyttiomyces sp. JEL0837]|nr:hypothetical protein HDU76_006931 [Blyttiomyces sp. JEL0837]
MHPNFPPIPAALQQNDSVGVGGAGGAGGAATVVEKEMGQPQPQPPEIPVIAPVGGGGNLGKIDDQQAQQQAKSKPVNNVETAKQQSQNQVTETQIESTGHNISYNNGTATPITPTGTSPSTTKLNRSQSKSLSWRRRSSADVSRQWSWVESHVKSVDGHGPAGSISVSRFNTITRSRSGSVGGGGGGTPVTPASPVGLKPSNINGDGVVVVAGGGSAENNVATAKPVDELGKLSQGVSTDGNNGNGAGTIATDAENLERRMSRMSRVWNAAAPGHVIPSATSPVAGSTPLFVTFNWNSAFDLRSETGELICTVDRTIYGSKSTFTVLDGLLAPICVLTSVDKNDEDMALLQNQFGGVYVPRGGVKLLHRRQNKGRITSEYEITHEGVCDVDFRLTAIHNVNGSYQTALLCLKDSATTLMELSYSPNRQGISLDSTNFNGGLFTPDTTDIMIRGNRRVRVTIEVLVACAVLMRYGYTGRAGNSGGGNSNNSGVTGGVNMWISSSASSSARGDGLSGSGNSAVVGGGGSAPKFLLGKDLFSRMGMTKAV